MANSYITYNENATISYERQSYPYTVALNHANRQMDIYGQRIDNSHTKDFAIRAYYTVRGFESQVNGLPLTIEDLLTLVTIRRGKVIEKEIPSMSANISRRNTRIKNLSDFLAAVIMAEADQNYDPDQENHSVACKGLGYKLSLYFTEAELREAKLWDYVKDHRDPNDDCKTTRTNGYIAKSNQLIKSKIDALNNDTQADTTRLDNLISKRDEVYSQSSDLAKKISDERATTIKNLR